MSRPAIALLTLVLSLLQAGYAQENVTRFSTFDRYDPTQLSIDANGAQGEHIDLRTLGVSWEVEDFRLPGDGGLDIVISRSFNKLSHTPSDMGHWYFGVPRLQIPTSPWRAPYDPARASQPTYNAAWNNLYARLDYGAYGICQRAGNLVDSVTTASITGQPRSGIFFAAPIVLSIPGEGNKVLLEKRDDADQFPSAARYVTTDNWYATCLAPSSVRMWGGFVVVSPDGRRFVFDFIKYLVPGDYGTHSAGGWVEMGASSMRDAQHNRIDYHYDLGPGGSGLLERIEASDGRLITLDWYSGSINGVDVQGSPLSLLSAVNVHADGQVHSVRYEYCDFSDFYIVGNGCEPIELGSFKDLPVLHEVIHPDGERTSYRYHPTMYSANVLFDWGNFEFLLKQVLLSTGGLIEYDYHSGFSPLLAQTDSPAPRLSARRTSGREVAPGTWNFSYTIDRHIERTTVTGPQRRDVYEFYEGLGTYEFRIARYPGQHGWPGAAPTDYDELMGLLRAQRTYDAASGELLRETEFDYALLPYIGEQSYGGNWLGSPTLVLAQIRPRPVRERGETDHQTSSVPLRYTTSVPAGGFDAYGQARLIDETGHGGPGALPPRRTEITRLHEVSGTAGWFIGLPVREEVAGRVTEREYLPGTGLLSALSDDGIDTRFEYDERGNLIGEIWQQAGQEYRRTLGDYYRGTARRVLDPIDPATGRFAEWLRQVDDLGRVVAVTDPLGETTQFDYDVAGRLLRVAEPGTDVLTYRYLRDASDLLVEVRETQGSRLRRTFIDGFGRPYLRRDKDQLSGDVRITRHRYDAGGRVEFRSFPYLSGSTVAGEGFEFSYDALGRLSSETATAGGQRREYCYEPGCLPADYVALYGAVENGYAVYDENDALVVREHASYGTPGFALPTRIVEQYSGSQSGADFRETAIEHDARDRVVRVVRRSAEDSGLERTFAYDGDRLVAETHPESGRTEYAYDERGNRTETRTPVRTIRHDIDGQGRVIAIDHDGHDNDIQFSYDDAGNLIEAANAHARWSYAYDAAGRLLGETLHVDGNRFEIAYTLDGSGRRTAVSYPDGEVIDLAPNAYGEPQRAGAVVDVAAYHASGTLSELRFGNGVVASFSQLARALPDVRRFTQPDGELLAGFRYSYDDVGNVVSIDNLWSPDRSLSAGYDPLGRLISADGYWGEGAFSYDIFDNIRRKIVGNYELDLNYDPANRLQAVVVGGSAQYPVNHDPEGKMLGSGFYTYEFNAAGQLSGISELPGLGFRYDAHGRRVAIDSADGTEYRVYDSAGILVHLDSCNKGGRLSDFVYIGTELVGRLDNDCDAGCHS